MFSLWGFVFAYSCANWYGYFGVGEMRLPRTSLPASCPPHSADPAPVLQADLFPASILSACSLPNDSGLTERKQSRPAWPWFSLRTASFAATKASLAPCRGLASWSSQERQTLAVHACCLVRVLSWSPECWLLVALGSWTLEGLRSRGLQLVGRMLGSGWVVEGPG